MNLTDTKTLKALLERHGFRFSKSLGQNFLIASWVPEKIAEAAKLDSRCGVLEIGPGVGCLTEQLAARAGKVVAIELDRALKPVLAETLAGVEHAELLFADALKTDFPALAAEKFAGLRPQCCANLPYSVTTPVLTALLKPRVFDRITVMIQREVARRICAKPGTAEYGAFTVFCNWYAVAEALFDVPPDCFFPRPKVCSTVLRLKVLKTPPAPAADESFFFRVVRAAFNQRRKTLENALANGLGGVPKEKIAAAIATLGLDARIRGEALGFREFATLADRLNTPK